MADITRIELMLCLWAVDRIKGWASLIRPGSGIIGIVRIDDM
jgi:hypothetical protein